MGDSRFLVWEDDSRGRLDASVVEANDAQGAAVLWYKTTGNGGRCRVIVEDLGFGCRQTFDVTTRSPIVATPVTTEPKDVPPAAAPNPFPPRPGHPF